MPFPLFLIWQNGKKPPLLRQNGFGRVDTAQGQGVVYVLDAGSTIFDGTVHAVFFFADQASDCPDQHPVLFMADEIGDSVVAEFADGLREVVETAG